MTDIVTPPIIDAMPPAPLPTDTPEAFNSKGFATVAAQEDMVTQVNASNAATFQNATAAHERALTATTKAAEAADSAAAASDDADRLASLDALWLGTAASDPLTGRDGVPLVAGNAYINTTSGLLRAYNGAAWVNGTNITAGVLSLNGAAGALLLKTVGGASLLGGGDVSVSVPFSRVAQYTASATFIVPGNTFVIRSYNFGKGGNAGTNTTGGGGGCAYGDIAVTPGDSVAVSISAGVAKVTIGGVDLLTANPASGTTAGTASKHVSVTNGGAYSGGSGVTAVSSGGASSGSPLGDGFNSGGAGSSGSGWGGAGNTIGGGGVGGAAIIGTVSLRRGGDGLAAPSTDPLLADLTGLGGNYSTATNQSGGTGGPGGGGGSANGTGTGGAGGFGAGGGYGANGGQGGFGGGAGGTSGAGGAAGLPGFGGGGATGASATGTAGGAAVIRIYY